jgi:hypothetical protein
MELTIRPMTRTEDMYAYTQSSQIMGQTGCIGHLRADMDSNGTGFFSSWEDHRRDLKTDLFKEEFDSVINALRFDSRYGDVLKDRSALARFCWSQPSARMNSQEENYGFRVDTDNYSYMMRLNPNKGVYNLYCYCYRRDWLDQHLKQAERGIRFIDSAYNTLFKLKDGGKIRVTMPDGNSFEDTCRYIDDYHLEVGRNLFHICEFAERMEANGDRIEPLEGELLPERKTRNRGDAR